jgi:hypothetical protein
MNSYDSNHIWSKGVLLRHVGPIDAVVEEDIEIFGVPIPKGYQTDGASVPRAFYNIIARFTLALPAALVHDLRYDPIPDHDGIKRRSMTRREADREFYDNLIGIGMSRRRAWAAWSGVRLAGGIPWRRGTKNGTLNVGDW